MPTISIIVAIARNNAIGKDNQLLWHLPDDLKRFKRITSGHPVIMGKKTYESLPVRPLPGRLNIVITDNPNDTFDGCETVFSIEEALAKCPRDMECFIIGGGSVYRQFMPLAEKLYITKVHKDFDADTFFPEITEDDWALMEESPLQTNENNSLSYSFLTYQRK
ncbi:MAG: dihydrofolate reductase [Bacteroidetes bacterium]|nr:dihydrofolate reductase [Bacteroidota bacterium]